MNRHIGGARFFFFGIPMRVFGYGPSGETILWILKLKLKIVKDPNETEKRRALDIQVHGIAPPTPVPPTAWLNMIQSPSLGSIIALLLLPLATGATTFDDWALRHGRTYSSAQERQVRRDHFERNVAEMRRQATRNPAARFEPDQWFDWSPAELDGLRGGATTDVDPAISRVSFTADERFCAPKECIDDDDDDV